MISIDSYGDILSSYGGNLSEVRKENSRMIMNKTFKGDIGYKRVYILDKDKGWIYEDAKYSKHATPSILKDSVDYYLQFRPYVHYPVGTYVFIPDDTNDNIGFSESNPVVPFKDPNFNMDKLWIIVGRNNANVFVRYNILQANWDFKWVTKYKGEYQLLHVIGCQRNANSYTAGTWQADIDVQLDNIINAWIPDVYFLYGNKIKDYDLCDTRYLQYEQRFILSHNNIEPKVYGITKVMDMVPQGIIKLTLKQEDFNPQRDNVDLMICDYYDDNGEVKLKQKSSLATDKKSYLWSCIVNDEGELETNKQQNHVLNIGKTSYFNVEFADNGEIVDRNAEWRLSYSGEDMIVMDSSGNITIGSDSYNIVGAVSSENTSYTEEEKTSFCKLITMKSYDKNIVSIRPGKTQKLIGKKFTLSVQDSNGDYASSMELEVQA